MFEGCHLQIALGLLVAGGRAQRSGRTVGAGGLRCAVGARGTFQASRILPQVMNAGVPASPFLAVIAPPSNCWIYDATVASSGIAVAVERLAEVRLGIGRRLASGGDRAGQRDFTALRPVIVTSVAESSPAVFDADASSVALALADASSLAADSLVADSPDGADDDIGCCR